MHMVSYSFILPYFERPKHLLKTLESYQKLYQNQNVEVLIVDDCSSPSKAPVIPLNFSLPIKILRINTKNGINPCVPYNIGARQARGETLILTSPEVVHTSSIFEQRLSLSTLDNSNYFIFSVFALSSGMLNEKLLATAGYSEFLNIFYDFKDQLPLNLGWSGYPWVNEYGSWYSHSSFRGTDSNFLSAIKRENFLKLSGFDERFRGGAGYDDLEFRQRLKKMHLHFEYLDEAVAVHLDHEIVTDCKQFGINLNSNRKLYRKTRFYRYKFNDTWGRAPHTVVYQANHA